MKLDCTKMICERDGKDIVFNGQPLSFERAICTALDNGSEAKISAEEKIKRFKLACRVYGEKLPVEISVPEAELIQRLINDVFTSPLVVAPILIAIEEAAGAEKEFKKPSLKAVSDA